MHGCISACRPIIPLNREHTIHRSQDNSIAESFQLLFGANGNLSMYMPNRKRTSLAADQQHGEAVAFIRVTKNAVQDVGWQPPAMSKVRSDGVD